MATFTSKATGNWSAGGQTTWNETGVPSFGDTVTINSPHVVTVDVNTTVGDAADPSALVIASGATLAIADSVTLTLYGGLENAGAIEEGDGSALNQEGGASSAVIAAFVSQACNQVIAAGRAG